jgi:hypothetical protein
MARISSSEKPLAIRPMTVEGRWPERKACIVATISAGSRPRIDGTGVITSVLVAWQPEQEEPPGGSSAAAAALAAASTNAPTISPVTSKAGEGGDPLTLD